MTHDSRLFARWAVSKDRRRQNTSIDGYRRLFNIHAKLAYILALPVLQHLNMIIEQGQFSNE
jgi:hypothetical protein